jgi:hypothetical protein
MREPFASPPGRDERAVAIEAGLAGPVTSPCPPADGELREWSREGVERMEVRAGTLPRVEIGDIRRGPGVVVTFEQGAFLLWRRTAPGAALEGPFRLGPAGELALLSLLLRKMESEPPGGTASCETVVALLSASGERAGAAGTGRGAGAPPTWDEANADIC